MDYELHMSQMLYLSIPALKLCSWLCFLQFLNTDIRIINMLDAPKLWD